MSGASNFEKFDAITSKSKNDKEEDHTSRRL